MVAQPDIISLWDLYQRAREEAGGELTYEEFIKQLQAGDARRQYREAERPPVPQVSPDTVLQQRRLERLRATSLEEIQRATYRTEPILQERQRRAYETEPIQAVQRAAYERPEEMREAFAQLPEVTHPLVPAGPTMRALPAGRATFEQLPEPLRQAISQEAFEAATIGQTQPLGEEWERKFRAEDVAGRLLTAVALAQMSPLLAGLVAEQNLELRELLPGWETISEAGEPVLEAAGVAFGAARQPISDNLQTLGVPENLADLLAEVILLGSLGKAPASQVRMGKLLTAVRRLKPEELLPATRAIERGLVRRPGEVGMAGRKRVPRTVDAQVADDITSADRAVEAIAASRPDAAGIRFVAPAIDVTQVPPTSGIWARMTNVVREARGLPALTRANFEYQARAKGVVLTYGKGLEESMRFREVAIADYRTLLPRKPRVQPHPSNDAPEWLRGTELDQMERPYAYAEPARLTGPRAQWQQYGNADIVSLQARGISIGLYDDYVFQHRYMRAFRTLGITRDVGVTGISATVRARMPMTQRRRFASVYDGWKASEGGVAAAKDEKGVVHAVLLGRDSRVQVGDMVKIGEQKAFGKTTDIMGEVLRKGPPLKPDTLKANELIGSRFEQSGILRAQKDVLDSVADLAVNTARRGVPDGYSTISNLPPRLADLKLLVEGPSGTRLVTVRRLAWPDEYARVIQGLIAPAELPGPLRSVGTLTMAARDVMLNLDPSMITLIYSRFPLGRPLTFLASSRQQARVVSTASGFRAWLRDDPMVNRFINGGGAGLFRPLEYTGRERPVLERFIPGLKGFNDVTMGRAIGFAAVKTAQTNEMVLRSVRSGIRLLGADKLDIPLTRIGRMNDQQILEAAVKSAMDQYGRMRYSDLGLSQWGRFGWRNAILTPGFLKTHLSLLTNTPKAFLGNPEGILGLLFLTQYVGISVGLAEALSRIQGYHTSIDPRSVNFGAIRTDFGTFTAMGQVRTYMRLFANTPGDLRARYYERFKRSGISRAGIVPQEIATQLLGEKYFGETFDSEMDRLIYTGLRRLPIGAQGVVEAFMGPKALDPTAASLAEWTGAAFWPARTRDLLNKISQGEYGQDWADIEDFQREEIFLANENLRDRAHEEVVLVADRGQPWARRILEREDVFTRYEPATNDALSRVETVNQRGDARRRLGAIEDATAVELRNIDRRYPEEMEYLRGREPKRVLDALRGQMMKILEKYPSPGERTEEQDDLAREEMAQFWQALDPIAEAMLRRNMGLQDTPVQRELSEARRVIGDKRATLDGRAVGFWDLPEVYWARAQASDSRLARFPKYSDFVAEIDRTKPATISLSQALTQMQNQMPALAEYRARTTSNNDLSAIDAWRRQFPEVDAYLVYWNYRGFEKVLTEEAQRIYQEEFGEEVGIR